VEGKGKMLFIVMGPGNYGETGYFVVEAGDREEASNKATKKAAVMPCPIDLDENGVSQLLIHT